MTSPHRLPDNPQVPRPLRSRLLLDFERFKTGLPAELPAFVRERYGMDLTAECAGRRIRLPFGKASGQLSMSAAEVQADGDAQLGFVVLKTVIAEDAAGRRSMEAWAIHETAMRVEPIASASLRRGWTVTWKGRGWDRSFDDYLALYREALEIGSAVDMPVAASVKYHLPGGEEGDEGDEGEGGEGGFRVEEYEYTTRRIAEVGGRGAIIEKDFSPTLAGDHRALARENVLRWIREVPTLVNRAARVTLGLKLMNALFDDAFQVEMLRAAQASGADFLVCFNRLYDPVKQVAYGGWDLSDRNLRVLDLMAEDGQPTAPTAPTAPAAPLITGFSATGNICSGRMMTEYALRGATSGQIHTFFQLPLGEYPATAGTRPARALHALLFHPQEGLIAWMAHLGETGELSPRDGLLHFLDIAHERARHSA